MLRVAVSSRTIITTCATFKKDGPKIFSVRSKIDAGDLKYRASSITKLLEKGKPVEVKFMKSSNHSTNKIKEDMDFLIALIKEQAKEREFDVKVNKATTYFNVQKLQQE